MRSLIVIALLLAGCTQPTLQDDVGGAPAAKSLVPGLDVFLPVEVNGQATEVAMTYWAPVAGSERVVLALHGSGGARWNHGPIGVPGYSFAHSWVDAGYAVASLDMPNYGDSPAAGLQTMDEFADVVVQVVDQLRRGTQAIPSHTEFIAFGISMGALNAQMAHAAGANFDAIISASWSYGGFSEEYQECVWLQQNCPENLAELVLVVDNVEPAVMAFLVNQSAEIQSPTGSVSTNRWAGCPVTPELGPPGGGPPRAGTCAATDYNVPAHEVTQAIDVPLLLVWGEEDVFWADWTNEPNRFPAADVSVLEVERTGHFVLFQRTHPALVESMIAWADAIPR